MEVLNRSGCYLWPNGVQYNGTWEKGFRHGNGVEKHAHFNYKVISFGLPVGVPVRESDACLYVRQFLRYPCVCPLACMYVCLHGCLVSLRLSE